MSEISLRKDSIISKILMVLLIVLNVLFLVYWVGLSLNYCLHYDDVHFMWKMQEYSIFEYIKEMYMTRGGNFVGYGLNGIIFTISNWVEDYHFWPLVFYVIGVAMTYSAVKGLLCEIKDWKLLLGVMTIYNIYILTVPDYAVFTWLCAMCYFLYGPALCLILRLINKSKLTVWRWVMLLILALFLSGSNVTITPMVWLLMLANGIWIWKQNDWNLKRMWENTVIKRIVGLTLGMLMVYVIMFVAPGNYVRLNNSEEIHPETLNQFVVAWVKCIVMYVYFMAFYIPYHLLAVGLGYIAGSQNGIEIKSKWKVSAFIILAFFVYLGIAVIPLAYLSNGFGIQRNYTHITFLYVLMLFGIGYVLGCGSRKQLVNGVLCIVCTIMLMVIMAINIKIDLPLARAYNMAHQKRENLLINLQEQGNKETTIVTPYPSTATLDVKYVVLKMLGRNTNKQAIYYESDTDVQPNEYEGHVKKLLKLNFDFVLADKKNR